VNGQDCLEQARATLPHAVVMDIHMPVMTGIEATRRLRASEEFGAIPIIAASASASGGDADRCFAAGANAFIPKPVSLDILQAHLGTLLNLTWVCE
jgi:CheY-like chemotaxis protein